MTCKAVRIFNYCTIHHREPFPTLPQDTSCMLKRNYIKSPVSSTAFSNPLQQKGNIGFFLICVPSTFKHTYWKTISSSINKPS